MRREFACLSLALLFIAHVVPSFAQKTAPVEGGEEVVRVREGSALELKCALRVEQSAVWQRDGGHVPPELTASEEPRDGGMAALLRGTAAPRLAGVYTCANGSDARRLRLVVESASAQSAPGETPAGNDSFAGTVVYYEVYRNTSIRCTLDNPSKEAYVWEKNGTALDAWSDVRGRYRLEDGGALLVLPARTHEDDHGNYSCALPAGARQEFALRGRPYAKLPPNTNVVEGQKLRLACKVVGKPVAAVQWFYSNDSDSEAGPGAEARAALGEDRVQLQPGDSGLRDGELVIQAARRGDAGRYTCRAVAPAAARSATPDAPTTVRVKDMYAALWPFLGICAEVLVLCAVILVYEKRRTKPELDDSDTDNHDQKKS